MSGFEQGIPEFDDRYRAYMHFSDWAKLHGGQQLEHGRATQETMRRISSMAVGFERAMRECGMPVDYAEENIYAEAPDGEHQQLTRVKRYPLWIVLEGSDLSGRAMRRATVSTKNQHGPHAGTYDPEDIDPATIPELRRAYFQTLVLEEKAVAVTGIGEVLPLGRSRTEPGDYEEPVLCPRDFVVADRPITARDLFDTEANVEPAVLVEKMQKRLEAAMDRYKEKLAEERAQGPVYRDDEYYQPQYLPPKQLVQHEPVRRGVLRKILGR
jgi:hypothetical protein